MTLLQAPSPNPGRSSETAPAAKDDASPDQFRLASRHSRVEDPVHG